MLEELVIGTVVGGVAVYLLRDKWAEVRINRLKAEIEELESVVYSCKQRERGIKGMEAKQEKAEMMQSAMLEFVTAIKSGGQPIEVLKALAVKYPSLALDLAKKGGLGL